MSKQQLSILHINKFHYLRGGAEAVYLKTAQLVKGHGNRSIFFSMHHPKNPSLIENGEYFMPYLELNIDIFPIYRNLPFKIRVAGRILYSFKARKLLSKLLDKYAVDIAHLHNFYHHISPSILHELKKRKIPVVMTLHDYKTVCGSYSMLANGKPCNDCREKKYFMAVKNRCVKDSLVKSFLTVLEMYIHHSILNIYDNVNIFISPSLFLKNKLEEMGFRKNIVYLPNFIDVQEFREFNLDAKDKKGEKENSIVYFGRISQEKGLLTLIKAAKLLYNRKSKIEVKIIGDGPIKKALQEKIKAKEINNVRFFGYMSGEPLFKEIKKSTTVVLPSETYENNPMAVIEAFIMGIPVIGARIGGIPELVRDYETGLTFEPGNPEDLYSKIEYLANNPVKAAEMGENARAFVEQELNAEKHYEKLMEIYRQVAS